MYFLLKKSEYNKIQIFQSILCWILLIAFTLIYFNGTQIDDTKILKLKSDNSINNFIFGEDGMGNFVHRFYSLENEYRYKQNWGLNDAWTERNYYSLNSKLGSDALSGMRDHQGRLWSNALVNSVKNEPLIKALRTPAQYALIAVAIYSGKTIEQNIGDDFILRSRSHFQSSQFKGEHIGVDTPLINTSFEYMSVKNTNVSAEEFKEYKVGLSKNISQISTSVGTSYSMQSKTRSVSLSKELAHGVGVNYENTQSQKTSNSYKLGVGFLAEF